MTSGVPHRSPLLVTRTVVQCCCAVETLEKGIPSRETLTLERCAYANLWVCNKAKCKVLHVSQSNPRHSHRLGMG